MKKIHWIVVIVLISVTISSAYSNVNTCCNFIEDVERIKLKFKQDKNIPPALNQLIHDAELAMKSDVLSVVNNPPVPPSGNKNDYYSWAPYLWPNPDTDDGYPYISKDGITNPETEKKSDKPLLRRMSVAVHTLALAYYYTDDKRYAQKASDLIRSWFLDPETKMNPNLNYAQCEPGVEVGRSSGIIDTRWLILVVDAIELLHHTGALSATNKKNLDLWFEAYLNWLLTSKNGQEEAQNKNNHGSWYAAQTACFALFIGNDPLAKRIIDNSKTFFVSQIDSLGRQVHELHRTKSFDYSLYNIHALITLAMMADQMNIDLWHHNMPNGKNLHNAIQYVAKFNITEKEWPYQQISERAITLDYGDGLHFSVYYPYDLYSTLRVGYKIYEDSLFLKSMKEIPVDKTRTHRSNLLIYLD